MRTQTATNRLNGHDRAAGVAVTETLCEYCGQPAGSRAIQARIAAVEQAKAAEAAAAITAKFTREKSAIEAQARAAVAKATKTAIRDAEQRAKAGQEEVIAQRLTAQRETMAKELDEAIGAERARHAEEKIALEQRLTDALRRLAAKPAHAIGAPAEKSLLTEISALLAEAAPDDVVERVGPGVRDADLIVSVVHPETKEVAGRIIIESKATSRWQSNFTRVLRENQLQAGAAFAILSTATMPAGCREFAVIDSVILATAERVPMLIALLRRVVLDNHTMRLGVAARDAKAERLFTFVTSPNCDDLFRKLLRLGRELAALDVAEAKANEKVFAKRAGLIQGVLDVRETFAGTVAAILAGGQ